MSPAPAMPDALGCPKCTHVVEVSEEDADASVSDLYHHIFDRHANYDQPATYALLAKARQINY